MKYYKLFKTKINFSFFVPMYSLNSVSILNSYFWHNAYITATWIYLRHSCDLFISTTDMYSNFFTPAFLVCTIPTPKLSFPIKKTNLLILQIFINVTYFYDFSFAISRICYLHLIALIAVYFSYHLCRFWTNCTQIDRVWYSYRRPIIPCSSFFLFLINSIVTCQNFRLFLHNLHLLLIFLNF